jgi:hypothetical protein
MSYENPWQPGFGRSGRWRIARIPFILLALIVLFWLYQYSGLLFGLGEWYLTPDGDTTLELREEVVLARLPSPAGWKPTADNDGLILALYDSNAPTGRGCILERWTRPWKEGKREPAPDTSRAWAPRAWRDQPALRWYFGLNGNVTRDGRLLAAVDHIPEGSPETRILALPAGKEVGRIAAIPAAVGSKDMAWHPTENVLVIGSYGYVTLAAGPDWKARTLATARRDYVEWETRVRRGEEESGYHPNENVYQLVFSNDGKLLLAAMDRGVRVYDWQDVRGATDRLPAPRHAMDGTLVSQSFYSSKMTFSVAHDAQHCLVLWSENDGTLKFLSVTTGEKGTLLALNNRHVLTRLHLCATGDALVVEIVRMGKSNSELAGFVVLDYPKLLQQAGVAP